MKRNSQTPCLIFLAVCLIAATAGLDTIDGQSPAADWKRHKARDSASLVTAPDQLEGALLRVPRTKSWKPQVNEERVRGIAADVYPKVAPAVVVVKTHGGHGTGFLVGSDGWIITNHHVIQDADLDPATHALSVTIFRGMLGPDGWMRLDENGLKALVYKSDADLDLALLKLQTLPTGVERLAGLALADGIGTPGAECVAIGHPQAGQLWTVRDGEVANSGIWPIDMLDVVMSRLSLSPGDQRALGDRLGDFPRRRVVLSTCGLNPGDSGGPLVNAAGEVVGVSFAIPSSEPEETVHLDKFSYHIHVAELAKFLKQRPDAPSLYVPSPWPAALYDDLIDLTHDDIVETWIFYRDKSGAPCGFVTDVDQKDSRINKLPQTYDPSLRERWDFEFALCSGAAGHAFYDTDNVDGPDLILSDVDDDGAVDVALKLSAADRWELYRPKSRKLVDAAHFRDAALRSAFNKLEF